MLFRVTLAISGCSVRNRLANLLRADDVVTEVVSGRGLWGRAIRKSCDLILVSGNAMPEPFDASLQTVRSLPESPAVVVICETGDPQRQARFLSAGCDMVLYAHLPEESLREALRAVLAKREGLAAKRPMAQASLSDFVSESPAMHAFLGIVSRVVPSKTALLVLGETGVGKERLARAIHAEGPRRAGPFVAVNCGALPESLLESELFGHEEGAFTGATRSRRGAFELAHNGTIFLDEIGEMPHHLQVKLLRVLQDHEIQRVGGEKPFQVDVRVVAASNRNLEEEVEHKRFRKDLYYRLGVVSLTVPPLRQRVQDIPDLVENYIHYLRPRIGREVRGIDQQAMAALKQYFWPGNVRELINVVERAMLLCGGDQITAQDLPASIRDAGKGAVGEGAYIAIPKTSHQAPAEWLHRPLKEVRDGAVEALERSYLSAMLKATGGRIGQTAQRSGIEARSVYAKMRRYGLRKEDFRPGKG